MGVPAEGSEWGYGIVEVGANPIIVEGGPDLGVAQTQGEPAPSHLSLVANLGAEALDEGEFDAPGPEVAAAEGRPIVPERDPLDWVHDRVKAVRAAGKRGTSTGRRDTRGRTFADREKPPFVGRYPGKCKVTPQMLNVEYGGLDPDSDIAGPVVY